MEALGSKLHDLSLKLRRVGDAHGEFEVPFAIRTGGQFLGTMQWALGHEPRGFATE